MAAATAPMQFPALDDSIGAFMLGTFLTVFLGGVTTTQFFTYCVRFHYTDRLLYKAVVYFLFVLDTGHSAVSCYTVYFWTVTHYGDLAVLAKSPWSFTVDPMMTALATIICQSFFAYRVYLISNRVWHIPSLIMVLSAVQFGFGVGASFKIWNLNSLFSRFGEWTYGVATWLVCAALADVIITLSLVYYLRKATKSEYSKTQTLVARIIRNTIETNALTMMVAIADAILFITHPSLAWHVLPNLLLVKLYFNSLLVSFNSRETATTDADVGATSFQGRQSHVPLSVYKGSPNSSGGSTFNYAGAAEKRITAPRVVVQTQSVIEYEKSHPYTAGREESHPDDDIIDQLQGINTMPKRRDTVPEAWEEQ